MRKAAMCLLVGLSLWGATSWQNQPQWRVVRVLALTNQTAGIPPTTVFTPAKARLYRYTIYLSGAGVGGQWSLHIGYNDLTGAPAGISMGIGPFSDEANALWANLPVAPFSAQPGIPVTFETFGGGPAAYNVGVTIEQLQ